MLYKQNAMIDLRSDTVTRPTPAMLDAMVNAEVGDDVFNEDPTVHQLEHKAAAIFGMQAGIFCPSGTMTNQIAIKVLTNPPGEVICDQRAHIYNYEGGGIAFNSGLSSRLVNGNNGIITPELVENNINPDDVHKPETQLVSVENTCNRAGGSIYGFADIKAVADVCKKHNLPLHVDGARIFNALVETGEDPKIYSGHVDTISICLSKGLGAPIGSVLVGSKEHIKKARRIRKLFGGGMRQVGILAAAGIYALDNHIERLKEDHAKARHLASELGSIGYVKEVYPAQTNIVVYELEGHIALEDHLDQLKQKGVLAVAFGPQTVRMVTHLDVSDDDISNVISALKQVNG